MRRRTQMGIFGGAHLRCTSAFDWTILKWKVALQYGWGFHGTFIVFFFIRRVMGYSITFLNENNEYMKCIYYIKFLAQENHPFNPDESKCTRQLFTIHTKNAARLFIRLNVHMCWSLMQTPILLEFAPRALKHLESIHTPKSRCEWNHSPRDRHICA